MNAVKGRDRSSMEEESRRHIHLSVETGTMLRHPVYHYWYVLKRPGLHGLCGVVQILKVDA